MLFAVEAVRPNLLVDDARRDADIRRGFPQHRNAAADAAAVVDILSAGGAGRVDEAGIFGAVGDCA